MTIALWKRPLTQVVNSIVKAGNGCWLDPSDMSTMFQDAAGTTPVTAVGQPVGKILDKSGNGNHATQSITASRPTLIYENGLYGLRFDGIDDYLNLPYMGLYANGSASVVMAKDEWPFNLNQMYVSEANSISGGKFYLPVRALLNNMVGGGCIVDSGATNFSLAIPIIPSASVVTSVVDSGDLFKFFRDGSLIGKSAKNKTMTLTVNNLTIGVRNGGGVFDGFCKMKLYSLIITKSALTEAQRIRCERFLARKAGVIL